MFTDSVTGITKAGFGAAPLLGVALLSIAFFFLFMAWCQLRSVAQNEVDLEGSYRCKKNGEIEKSPRQLHHLGLKLHVILCDLLLVGGQPGKKRASLRNGLCDAAGVALVVIQRLLVNLEKLLFWFAVKISGNPLPVFFGRFVFHERVVVMPNDLSSPTVVGGTKVNQ